MKPENVKSLQKTVKICQIGFGGWIAMHVLGFMTNLAIYDALASWIAILLISTAVFINTVLKSEQDQ